MNNKYDVNKYFINVKNKLFKSKNSREENGGKNKAMRERFF